MTWTKWEKVEAPKFTDVLYEKKYRKEGGAVARISINRPEVKNAIRGQTRDDIINALDVASDDKSVGVVVLTGVGEHFCVGSDPGWSATGSQMRAAMLYGPSPDLAIMQCRQPVIAAVKGHCLGTGNHMPYFADLTIAADSAIFQQIGPRWGSPVNGWQPAYLQRVIGVKKAREMWMCCRPYTAKQALEMGLINAAVPFNKLEEEVDAYCEDILKGAPEIQAIIKTSMNADVQYLTGIRGLYLKLMAPNWFETPGYQEAVKVRMEGIDGNFFKQ